MSQRTPTLSIIIPAYNEEHRLPPTLTQTARFLRAQEYESEILIVTDGSTDGTAQVAREFANQFSSVRVLEFAEKRGKGFAVKTGMLTARGDYRLFMDADYAVPIEFATEFLAMLKNGTEIVIGSRGMADSKFEQKQGFPRRQLALVFGLLQRIVLQMPFKDTQCGFKMFTAQAAEKYFPLVTFECAYFDAELIYLAHRSGANIIEQAVNWRHDEETRLPIGPSRSLDLLLKLMSIRKLHRNNRAQAEQLQQLARANNTP